MRTPDLLERIRIAPNLYGVGLMRAFERNAVFAAQLADVLARECETGSRALYLGLLNSTGELVVRTRLVVDSIKAVFVDEMEAAPGQSHLIPELLKYAGDEANRLGRPLAVMAAEDDIAEWGQLGFRETGYRVLAL